MDNEIPDCMKVNFEYTTKDILRAIGNFLLVIFTLLALPVAIVLWAILS